MSKINLRQRHTQHKFPFSAGMLLSVIATGTILLTSHISPATAQSTDRDAPTTLTTNVISATGLHTEPMAFRSLTIQKKNGN